MLVKSVLVRLQGLRPRARAPTSPPCYATVRRSSSASGSLTKVMQRNHSVLMWYDRRRAWCFIYVL